MFKLKNKQPAADRDRYDDSSSEHHRPLWVSAVESGSAEQLRSCWPFDVNDSWRGRAGALQRMGDWTPLALATFCDALEPLVFLLEKGADPNKLFHRQGVSYSPLAYAEAFDKNNVYAKLKAVHDTASYQKI